MSRPLSLPLAASIAGHGGVLAVLILVVGLVPPVPLPITTAGIEVTLAPPAPVTEMPPPPPEPPPVPEAEPRPPEPSSPVVEAEPPPRVASPEPEKPLPPQPRLKPVAKRPPPQPVRTPPPEPLPPAPMQTALPKPPPPLTPAGPIVSAGYRVALGTWLESHKRYPDSARARGEEGRAVLRFHVDRSGRVLNYAVVQGTGYADLDAAIDQMMRGARLPPFPADMSATDVDVSVTIRFALTH